MQFSNKILWKLACRPPKLQIKESTSPQARPDYDPDPRKYRWFNGQGRKTRSQILEKEADGSMLRISVEGGGCSGFQYKYDIVEEQEDDDLVLAKLGATVLIDSISLQYMAGSEIDFVTDLMGQSFQITNPQAAAGCGCGTSFSI